MTGRLENLENGVEEIKLKLASGLPFWNSRIRTSGKTSWGKTWDKIKRLEKFYSFL